MITIKKGLDLPITGTPAQSIEGSRPVSYVALVGDDYPDMKPTMAVQVGDQVKLGQLLFTDKKRPGVKYTAPGCGKVVAINRGAQRKLESIVIELAGNEEETFESFDSANLTAVSRDQVVDILINSGMWTALRTRPFSKVSIAVTKMECGTESGMGTLLNGLVRNAVHMPELIKISTT